MQKSKLIGSLKALSKDEFNRFKEYMQSPFFKKSANSQRLFEWLYTYGRHPLYTSSQLDSKVVISYLFQDNRNKALKDKSLSVASSELIALLRDFLIYLEGEKKKNHNTYLLLQGFRRRGMEKDFWQVYKKIAGEIDKSVKTIDTYYEQYLLDELLRDFYPVDKHLQREKKKLNVQFGDSLRSFEIYVVLMKLQHACLNWSNASIVKEEGDKALAMELIERVESQQLGKILLVNVYYLVLLLLMDFNAEKHYYQLKELLKNKGGEINRDELRSFYTLASNYCNRRVQEGDVHFRKEMFDLYLLMLEEKFAYSGKYIRKRFVKNMVTLGLQVGETEWVEEFIEVARKETMPQSRDSVYAFSRGIWYFHHQDYSKALQMLLQVENIDVFYNLDCRGVLLKCYYELQETEPFFSLADAFRKLVKLQKIAPVQKKGYLNFIRQTVKLYKIKLHPNKSPNADFRQKMLEIQPINNQKWLLEKMEELLS